MIDDTEFSELSCIIDSREKRASRIERIKKFITSRGGMVEIGALKLCDYHIQGTFRGKEINLGIEFKEFSDYNNSKEDLNWKLFEAGKLYSEVALFVQENNFGLSFTDKGPFVKIPQVPDGSADITNYYAYKNQLDTFSREGIHVRTFQQEAFFEEDLYSLLIYIAKDCHNGLNIKEKNPLTQFLNVICKIDGVGGVKSHKFAEVYSNIEQFVNHLHYEGEYEKIAGDVTGKKIRAFLINNSREQECTQNYNQLFNKSLSLNSMSVNVDTKAGTLVQTERRTDKNTALTGQRPMSTDNTPAGAIHDDLQSSSAEHQGSDPISKHAVTGTPDPAGTNFKSISTTPSPAGNSHQVSKSFAPENNLSSKGLGDQQHAPCDVGIDAAEGVPAAIPGHSDDFLNKNKELFGETKSDWNVADILEK